MHPIRIHSIESGKKPISLLPGEIAINNYDGIMFLPRDDGTFIELRERNKFYDVAGLEERNELALQNVMRNGDYVRYEDNGYRIMEIYFDYKWFTMYRLVI